MKHDHCTHENLKHCSQCDVTHCLGCKREWGDCKLTHYPYTWTPAPYYYPQPTPTWPVTCDPFWTTTTFIDGGSGASDLDHITIDDHHTHSHA